MTIPRWRLAIVVGALIILSAIGGGFVQAASSSGSTASTGAVAPSAASLPTEMASDLPLFAGDRLRALRDWVDGGGLGRLGKHLVHATATVLDRDGKLITLQLDHGTISAIGTSSITIAEAGGSSVTVATTAETKVRQGRKAATLAMGNEVIVYSVVESGAARAKSILVLPVKPASTTSGAS